jgi:hypothetical protein
MENNTRGSGGAGGKGPQGEGRRHSLRGTEREGRTSGSILLLLLTSNLCCSPSHREGALPSRPTCASCPIGHPGPSSGPRVPRRRRRARHRPCRAAYQSCLSRGKDGWHHTTRTAHGPHTELSGRERAIATADSAVGMPNANPNWIADQFGSAGFSRWWATVPTAATVVIAEVALPHWRYVAGRGLRGRPSVRYRASGAGPPRLSHRRRCGDGGPPTRKPRGAELISRSSADWHAHCRIRSSDRSPCKL